MDQIHKVVFDGLYCHQSIVCMEMGDISTAWHPLGQGPRTDTEKHSLATNAILAFRLQFKTNVLCMVVAHEYYCIIVLSNIVECMNFALVLRNDMIGEACMKHKDYSTAT